MSAALPVITGDWLTDPRLQTLFDILEGDEPDSVRVAGGAVRSALLERPVNDIDLATTAKPEVITERAEAAGLRVIATGIEHGTVTVLHDGLSVEVTTLRRDEATDGRHATVAFTQAWEEDAARRDFTINALYCDRNGLVHDSVGGLEDIAARRIRFVGQPDERVAEDYLRVLRFFRFHSQLDVPISSPEGFSACVRARAQLKRLSPERIHQEMRRILTSDAPMHALRGLLDAGMLGDLVATAPRVTRALGVAQRSREIGLDDQHRFAVSLFALAIQTAEDVAALRRRLRLSNDETDLLTRLLDTTLPGSDASHHNWRVCVHEQGHDAVLLRLHHDFCVGLVGRSEHDRLVKQIADMEPTPLPVSGADLVALGLEPGPELGALLVRLEQRWVDGDFALSRQALLDMVEELQKELERDGSSDR